VGLCYSGTLPFDGVILNGLKAVKDFARIGSGPALEVLAIPPTCADPRQILHPAEAGLRMTPTPIEEGVWPEGLAFFGAVETSP
jgi:hypothetical protein